MTPPDPRSAHQTAAPAQPDSARNEDAEPDRRTAHEIAAPPRPNGAQNEDAVDLAGRIGALFTAGGSALMLEMGIVITYAEPGFVRFTLPVVERLTHGGGVLSGQAILAGMDTGMVFVMMSLNDATSPAFTTVELKTSFERGVPADVGAVTFEARATKPGRTLVFGQIDLFLPDGKRAATATTTYMWL